MYIFKVFWSIFRRKRLPEPPEASYFYFCSVIRKTFLETIFFAIVNQSMPGWPLPVSDFSDISHKNWSYISSQKVVSQKGGPLGTNIYVGGGAG